MVRKTIIALFILVVCMVTVSCRKLDEPIKPTGPMTFEAVKFPDAIPQDYGSLIGVTQNAQVPGWAGLWFQRPDGTITAVFVNVEQGKMSPWALKIPRK